MPVSTDPVAAGKQVLSILRPVVITMFVTLYFVNGLKKEDSDDEDDQYFATPAREKETDSNTEKAQKSSVNALFYIGMVTASTFLLVLLFKYNCMKIIYLWLFTATLMLLSSLGGLFLVRFCERYDIAIDVATFLFLLYNFVGVGVLAVYWKAPGIVKRGYLVCISAMMAWAFSFLEEWTAWALLTALALYDLLAVLTPCGPLKMLVEATQLNDSELPGLLYETPSLTPAGAPPPAQTRATSLPFPNAPSSVGNSNAESLNSSSSAAPPRPPALPSGTRTPGLNPSSSEVSPVIFEPSTDLPHSQTRPTERAPALRSSNILDPNEEDDFSDDGMEATLKLGLGDFVFYSVLIARASSLDLTAVVVCFVAVLSGLVSTLLMLAVFERALPALPVSITLGVLFYILTRYSIYPYLSDLASDAYMI